MGGILPMMKMSKKLKKCIQKIERKVNRLGSLNGHQSGNVYFSNGLSPALCCTDYKSPVKIIEFINRGGDSAMDKQIIEKNFTEIENGKFVTTSRERELLCSYHSPTQQTIT